MKTCVCFIIMALVAIGVHSGELEDFGSALMTAVKSDAAIPYELSGVAKVIKQGGSFMYSASLYNTNKNASIIRPEDMIPVFQKLVVPGYTYRATEVLTFASTTKMPLPAWRLQVKYTKSG